MKCSFGISDFLEEISSLSHSVDFLYFLGAYKNHWKVWKHKCQKADTRTAAAAAAAAKSLQSCLTLCDPRDSSPPRSAILGLLQARTLEGVAISFSNA